MLNVASSLCFYYFPSPLSSFLYSFLTIFIVDIEINSNPPFLSVPPFAVFTCFPSYLGLSKNLIFLPFFSAAPVFLSSFLSESHDMLYLSLTLLILLRLLTPIGSCVFPSEGEEEGAYSLNVYFPFFLFIVSTHPR